MESVSAVVVPVFRRYWLVHGWHQAVASQELGAGQALPWYQQLLKSGQNKVRAMRLLSVRAPTLWDGLGSPGRRAPGRPRPCMAHASLQPLPPPPLCPSCGMMQAQGIFDRQWHKIQTAPEGSFNNRLFK